MRKTTKRNAVQAGPVADTQATSSNGNTVVFWRATRPLTVEEHEALSEKLRREEEQTGLTITLVPFSVEVIVAATANPDADPDPDPDPDPVADPNPATDSASITGTGE